MVPVGTAGVPDNCAWAESVPLAFRLGEISEARLSGTSRAVAVRFRVRADLAVDRDERLVDPEPQLVNVHPVGKAELHRLEQPQVLAFPRPGQAGQCQNLVWDIDRA